MEIIQLPELSSGKKSSILEAKADGAPGDLAGYADWMSTDTSVDASD